ncbi:MAG: S8 family peptidase [Clostridia bacterium]|nr:S8 family peptidase [Clostridia bacterium]
MTDNSELLLDFVNDQNTTDFIIQTNEYYLNELQKVPFVKLTQTLADSFILGYVSNEDVPRLADLLGTNYYSSLPYVLGLLDTSALESSGITQVQEQELLGLKGQGVLVGIIDTGIDYTDTAFRYEDGTTRIVSIYDQSRIGDPPDGFFIGTEYTREQIDEALNSDFPYETVPQRDEVGHGTFLASVAAGRGSGEFRGAAPNSELVVVKLKGARSYVRRNYLVPEDNENVYESSAVMLGIEYIIKKAKELGRPVAICIGVGTNSGSHDGNTLFEQYLGIISNITGVCICTAAGNESQERHHARAIVDPSGMPVSLEINSGQNQSGIYVSLLSSASDRISVSLRSPTGEIVGRIPAQGGTSYTQRLLLERSRVTIEYYFPLSLSSGQATIIKIENATRGIWTINLYGDIILDGTVDAYLPLSSIGYDNVEFASPDPNYTIVVPGTAPSVITCGAYNDVDNTLFINSSWGPTRSPMTSPDLVAPGVNVLGIYPSGEGVMSGTSVASAITTGACALMLQWGIVEGNSPTLDTFQIKGYLIRGCQRDSTSNYPNLQTGYGRLDLYNSFNLMREI